MFIYTFLCFIIYTFTMSGLLSTMIYCVTTHFPSICCCPFTFLFYHEELYLSKEKQCYLFVMLPCKYAVSPLQSCKLHSPSCTNLLVPVKSLSQMFMSHIHYCMLGCVFIYWEYINHFMYRSVSGLFTAHNNWPKGVSQWFHTTL